MCVLCKLVLKKKIQYEPSYYGNTGKLKEKTEVQYQHCQQYFLMNNSISKNIKKLVA